MFIELPCKKLLTVDMALLKNGIPKLFWVVVLAFEVVQSTDSDTVQPAEEEVVICENSHENIQCEYGTIKIRNAYYGRTDKHTCPHAQMYDTNCKGTNALDVLRKKCDNNDKCHLEASNNWFGDPCPNTYKYLRFDFTCGKDQPTHVEHICESQSKKIRCPEGTLIKIKNASYGRTDKNICPNQNIKTTNCRAENSLSIVNKKCENKNECHLEASNNWFKDPCEGTHKYLSVEYQCVQDSIHKSRTITICENNTQKITCPRGTSLIIEDAFYGRTDKSICPHQQIYDTQCKAGNAFQVVNNKCTHKTECELQSVNTWFGDPCQGTYKYLQVKYKCD
ncbi:unnamed protein product [Nezara viridula]|uniref:SUEL-type lectin domain-containing protein n=1 Tax=Nezara viridula TaxID=85310 RepID=A0A9P0HGH3_NEZVI|nr:unnamed protein product [Nezara viridula]